MVTVGGQISKIETQKYQIAIIDRQGKEVELDVVGIEKISSAIGKISVQSVAQMFGISEVSLNRPVAGEVDILIGLQYAAYHPDKMESRGHLILYKNRFGTTIGGSHPSINEETVIVESCAQVRVAVSLHAKEVPNAFFEGKG